MKSHSTFVLYPLPHSGCIRLESYTLKLSVQLRKPRTNICRTSVIQAQCRVLYLCSTVKQQSCRTEPLSLGYLMYWPESVRTFLLSPTRACICWEQWSCFLLRAVMAFSRSHLGASAGTRSAIKSYLEEVYTADHSWRTWWTRTDGRCCSAEHCSLGGR